jgi:hypothetical protein
MALFTFYQIFRVVDADTLLFINNTRIGGSVYPANSILKRGLVIAGIDFFNFIGNNMEVTDGEDGTKTIEKVYV